MIVVYRATAPAYAGDLSGEGARRYGGRWNERGVPALYTASSVALTLLESLVHIGDKADYPKDFTISVIEVDGELQTLNEVPTRKQFSQQIGTALLRDPGCLGFWVPSIVVRQDLNLVLNPHCTDFGRRVRLRETFVQALDERLHE